jgi:AcrR family transcriptional regulator
MNIKFAIPCFAALKPDASVREKILTAANEILLTVGFSALTQQAVAARAGVRQSHLTYYFPTRNDLLRETAQFGVEALFLPIAETAAAGTISIQDLRQLLMPEKSDRQWFRLMTGLASASEEDESIRQWMREFDAGLLEKLTAGFAAVGVPISQDHANFLHATFIGALHLDMVDPSDESFERVTRAVATALDVVLPRIPAPSISESHGS